jgi:hypothetical protein
MTPEDYAKNYFCGGSEPATPYEKGIVGAVAGLIRQAVLSEVSNFISEAVEQEREACAEVADDETSKVPIVAPGTNSAWDECAREIASTIRARGEK